MSQHKRDISPDKSVMNTIEAYTRRHNPERVDASGEWQKLRIPKELLLELATPASQR